MLAFELSVNGAKRNVAGHAKAHTLTVWISGQVKRPFNLPPIAVVATSAAIPQPDTEQLAMLQFPNHQLSVGDEVTIRLVDVDSVDEPERMSTGAETIVIEKSAD